MYSLNMAEYNVLEIASRKMNDCEMRHENELYSVCYIVAPLIGISQVWNGNGEYCKEIKNPRFNWSSL